MVPTKSQYLSLVPLALADPSSAFIPGSLSMGGEGREPLSWLPPLFDSAYLVSSLRLPSQISVHSQCTPLFPTLSSPSQFSVCPLIPVRYLPSIRPLSIPCSLVHSSLPSYSLPSLSLHIRSHLCCLSSWSLSHWSPYTLLLCPILILTWTDFTSSFLLHSSVISWLSTSPSIKPLLPRADSCFSCV